MTTRAWILGRGGMLGQALAKALGTRGAASLFEPARFSWADPTALAFELDLAIDQFAAAVASGERWLVVWAAGAGVIGTEPSALRTEIATIEGLLSRLERAALPVERGALFLASSAGGIYGDTPQRPLTERSAIAPLSAYGRNKRLQEELFSSFSIARRLPLLIGRISTLYGPNQNLAKPQGFISQLSSNMLRNRPTNVFVSLDTQRDFLFVDDCAEHINDCIERLLEARPSEPILKIFASEESCTLGSIVASFRRITKHQPQIVSRATAVTKEHAGAQRYRSTIWRDTRPPRRTALLAGLHLVHQANLAQLMRGAPQFKS